MKIYAANICRLIGAVLVFCVLLFSGCKAETPTDSLSRLSENDESPRLSAVTSKGLHLQFNLVPTGKPLSFGLKLVGKVRAPYPYTERYGGRITSAVQLIAIDPENGCVYHGTSDRPGTVPLDPLSDKDIQRHKNDQATVSEIEADFTVDLIRQLNLPAKETQWHIFMWMDDCVTPVKTVRFAGQVNSNSMQECSKGNVDNIVELHAADHSSIEMLGPGSIRLELSCLQGRDCEVRGVCRVRPEDMDAKWLSLFSLCQHSRVLHFRSVPVQPEVCRASGITFAFNPNTFAGCTSEDARVYFLAVVGDAVSNVLVIERPYLHENIR